MKSSIISTLAYSDIFEYPLTANQLWQYLICASRSTKDTFFNELESLGILLGKKGKLYCLLGSERIFTLRGKRESISKQKIKLARRVVSFLAFIPTVKFIGISGTVALLNADKDHDIDFFVISANKTLWITRLLILVLLEFMGVRRKRNSRVTADTICVNMLIDQSCLSWPTQKRNLYTAHEIAQVRVLFDRGNTYETFLKANSWVANFMPNFLSLPIMTGKQDASKKIIFKNLIVLFNYIFMLLNPLARVCQMWYMKKHKTREVATNNFASFHPKDYTAQILQLHKERVDYYTQMYAKIENWRNELVLSRLPKSINLHAFCRV